MAESIELKIADIRQKIEIELKCRDGAENMISKLHDAVAIDACEMRILESTRRLDYLERELRNYELKRLVKINPSSASAAGSSANNSGIGGGGGGASSTIVRKQQQQQQLGVNGTPVLPTISPITPLLSANTLLTTYNLPNPEPPLMESKSLPPVPHPPLSGDISLIRPSSATAATGDLVDDTSTLDYNEITTPSPVLDFSPHFNLGPSSSNNNNNKRNSDPGLVPSNSDYSYSSGPTSGRHSVYVDTPNAGDGGGDVAASSSATANTTNYNNTTSPSVVASATGYSLQHISNVTPSRSVQQYHQPHPSQSPPSSSLSFNRLSIDPNNNNNNSLMNASFVSTSQPHLAQRTSVFETIFSSFGVGKGRSSTISGARSATSSISSLNSSVNNSEMFASKTSYTQFDFNLQETMITSEKVRYKLFEVRFKLDVEQKLKSGSERMLAAVPPGSSALVELESRMKECDAKVGLLQKAESKYKSLYFEDDDGATAGTSSDEKTGGLPSSGEIVHNGYKQSTLMFPVRNIRRPLTGKLYIRIGNANNLIGKKSSKTESLVIIKVDGTIKGTTRPSKGGKWNEDFVITVDKASEIELSVYEKGHSGNVLGLAWFKLWELDEAIMARRRIESESQSAAATGGSGGGSVGGVGTYNSTEAMLSFAGQMTTDGLESPLELEPSGKLGIRVRFVHELRSEKIKDGVVRRKNVKKVFPKRGHKFALQQFYQVIKCAACGDFLMSGQGLQCQSCKYTCHKSCGDRVMIKCITKVDERDDDELQMLRHKIPHRFEACNNLTPNWCCHCGHILPLGKKQSFKCSECSIMAHRECAHLVPNFCGLSAAMIEQMMSVIASAEKSKREKSQLLESARNSRISEAAALFSNDQRRLSESGGSSGRLGGGDSAAAASGSHGSLSGTSEVDSAKATIISGSGGGRSSRQNSLVPGSVSMGAAIALAKTAASSSVIVGGAATAGVPSTLAKAKPGAVKAVGLNDFNFLAVLGKGNFGKVMLAEEKTTRKLYAIKVLKKEFIIENDEVESTRSEKRVFLVANRERFPFLVNLHSCFQTESRIYFVMEYVSGGDLMWHIQHEQFTEARSKYYACEVLLALEYFHKNQIVYRDLKLDNILLTVDGHIKIADYGLCKENMGVSSTTRTFCGTPEFMAPEILQEKPYGKNVDWWALGVLLYEMLLGQSPFRGEDEDEIFESILNDEILYPVNMAKDAVDLLQKLLTKDPSKRIGHGKSDSEEIKSHPYFRGVNWDDVLHTRNRPPFVPVITSPTDVSNFDSEFTKEIPVLTPCHSVLSAADQEEFRGFTHLSDWALDERTRPK